MMTKEPLLWIPDGDIKLRPKTFRKDDIKFLLEGDNLFARKFDDKIDNNIIDSMKKYFYQPLNEIKQLGLGRIVPDAILSFRSGLRKKALRNSLNEA